MYTTNTVLSSAGVQSTNITATGVYQIMIGSVPGVTDQLNLQAGEVAFQLAGGTTTATVQLQAVDGTAIGDSMSLSGTSIKCLTASSVLATVAFIGPRYLNVSALGSGCTLTMSAYFQ